MQDKAKVDTMQVLGNKNQNIPLQVQHSCEDLLSLQLRWCCFAENFHYIKIKSVICQLDEDFSKHIPTAFCSETTYEIFCLLALV